MQWNNARLLVVAMACALPAAAQSVLSVTESCATQDLYGWKVAFVGDTDGDGVSEFAACAVEGQRIYVHDGTDSSVKLKLKPTILSSNGYGSSADGADWDGDGLADIAIGSNVVEKVRLVRGLDGAPIAEWSGLAANLTVVGDVDADGVPDLLCGQDGVSGVSSPGLANLYSAASGATVFSHTGAHSSDNLGWAIAGIGDIDGDAVPDYVLGVPGDDSLANDGGAVEVRSGADGSLVWRVAGSAKNRKLGSSVAPVGDVDLDGTPDLVAGAPGGGPIVDQPGSYALVQSGADGSTITGLYAPPGTYQYGFAAAGPGDVTGDGHPDVLLRLITLTVGRLDLVDGVTGATGFSFIVDELGLPDPFQGSLDAGQDLNADGAADLLASWMDVPPESGRVFLISTVDLPWEHLGHALSGTQGKPVLRAEGPLVAGEPVTLHVAQALASTTTWMVVGLAAIELPFKGGVMVPSVDVLLPFATDAAGKLVLTGPWPAGVPAGFASYFQAWTSDAGGPAGWSATNALLAESP